MSRFGFKGVNRVLIAPVPGHCKPVSSFFFHNATNFYCLNIQMFVKLLTAELASLERLDTSP